jgi:hypothetical protein
VAAQLFDTGTEDGDIGGGGEAELLLLLLLLLLLFLEKSTSASVVGPSSFVGCSLNILLLIECEMSATTSILPLIRQCAQYVKLRAIKSIVRRMINSGLSQSALLPLVIIFFTGCFVSCLLPC